MVTITNNELELVNKDFPGATVDKNRPANAGDTGSVSDPGRFHMPQCH